MDNRRSMCPAGSEQAARSILKLRTELRGDPFHQMLMKV